MKNIIFTSILVALIVACSHSTNVQAKSSAPVTIEYSVPKNIGAGSQVNTTISFVALTDLPKLIVSAAPYTGLVVLSGGEQTVFTDLRSGESRELEVSISLEDDRGYLAVYAATTDSSSRTKYKNIAIRYGNAEDTTNQKKKSQYVSEDASGEVLIILPAEDR